MVKEINSDLVNLFTRSAEEVTATVEVISYNAESLNISLQKAAGNENVLLAEPDYINPELFLKFKQNKNVVTKPTKEQLTGIKTGITDAFCGIASTGSVCVSITKNLTCPASMLTRKHIVVLNADTIVPRPRDIFSEDYLDGKGLHISFTIITGPSATADMGPLVRGVHGPGKIHIIILE